ncbi:uncharacterized protein LOC134796183 [Cydia splendana]|uniref:uncharacterized protein LOC134796183 n=1 Tax=Cydia splendana TaxID=1100963 RepID=UPI00300CAFA6
MADPKYENLPGIAYDQPDVYETGDLPEADQQEPFEEEENECIETLHLSVKDSFNNFKGKFLTGAVDFSDRLSRKSRIGYRAGEYELAAEGEPETVLERYNRLRCEFSDLLEQVAEQQNKATESEKDEYSRLATQINATKKILEELKLEEGEHVDPTAEKLKEYLAQGGKKKQPGVATASLKLKPEVNLAQTTRIAQLEHRLHKLEQAAGVRDEEAFRRLQAATGEATLCGAAATLAAQTALLRPAELAAADARAASLLANVEAIRAARPSDPELDAKVNYTLCPRRKVATLAAQTALLRPAELAAADARAASLLANVEAIRAARPSDPELDAKVNYTLCPRRKVATLAAQTALLRPAELAAADARAASLLANVEAIRAARPSDPELDAKVNYTLCPRRKVATLAAQTALLRPAELAAADARAASLLANVEAIRAARPSDPELDAKVNYTLCPRRKVATLAAQTALLRPAELAAADARAASLLANVEAIRAARPSDPELDAKVNYTLCPRRKVATLAAQTALLRPAELAAADARAASLLANVEAIRAARPSDPELDAKVNYTLCPRRKVATLAAQTALLRPAELAAADARAASLLANVEAIRAARPSDPELDAKVNYTLCPRRKVATLAAQTALLRPAELAAADARAASLLANVEAIRAARPSDPELDAKVNYTLCPRRKVATLAAQTALLRPAELAAADARAASLLANVEAIRAARPSDPELDAKVNYTLCPRRKVATLAAQTALLRPAELAAADARAASLLANVEAIRAARPSDPELDAKVNYTLCPRRKVATLAAQTALLRPAELAAADARAASLLANVEAIRAARPSDPELDAKVNYTLCPRRKVATLAAQTALLRPAELAAADARAASLLANVEAIRAARPSDPELDAKVNYTLCPRRKVATLAAQTALLRPAELAAADARAASLLANVEAIRAARPSDPELDAKVNYTLCPRRKVATLAAQTALLRPAELAAADARAASLLANVEAIRAARPSDPELDAKVNELYKLVQQIDGISHSEILERMEALESLHNQASNFGKSLTELETLQSTIASGVKNNKELLQGVQEVFAHNIDSLQKEIKKLDDRIGKLTA